MLALMDGPSTRIIRCIRRGKAGHLYAAVETPGRANRASACFAVSNLSSERSAGLESQRDHTSLANWEKTRDSS